MLSLLLEHARAMAEVEPDAGLREQWAAMAQEIREYLEPVDDDLALPGM